MAATGYFVVSVLLLVFMIGILNDYGVLAGCIGGGECDTDSECCSGKCTYDDGMGEKYC